MNESIYIFKRIMKEVVIDSLPRIYRMAYLTFFVTILIGMCILSAEAFPQLQVTPSSLTQTINEGSIYNSFLNIKNIGNQNMVNLSFTKIKNITIGSIPSVIAPNQSINISISANAVTMNNISIASFFYLSNTTSTPKTYNISINSISFVPPYLEIKQGDSIQWKNIDNLTRSAVENSFLFNYQLTPNQTATHLFNSIGTTDYFSQQGGFSGQIVTNTNSVQQFIHISSLDVNFPIQITRNVPQANTTLDLFTTDFSLEYNQVGSAVARVSNGNSNSYGLKLNSLWAVNFSSNNFNLNPNAYQIVTFYAIPRVTKTNQTNRTYNIELNLTGTNIAKQTKTMNIFVKYHKFNDSTSSSGNNVTILTVITSAQLQALCQQQPDLCPKREVNITIFKPMPTTVNVTSDVVEGALKNIATMGDSQQRIENINKESITKQEGMFATIKDWFGHSNRYENQTAKDISAINSNIFFMKWYGILKDFAFFIVISGILIAGFLRWKWERGDWKFFSKKRYGF